MLLTRLLRRVLRVRPAPVVEAHCDGPCGVYDPAAARVAAEAVLSMTQKLATLERPASGDPKAEVAYLNTFTRFVKIKEEQAEIAKRELLILWTDYFQPDHLTTEPHLHELFWRAAKLCSTCKVEVSEGHAVELLEAVQVIHAVFWKTKHRKVAWYTAA